MQQHTGIVLKRYVPKRQKISVLDAQLGRIEAVIRDERLLQCVWPGMELAYIPLEGHGIHILDHAVMIAAPFKSAQHDIGFLHHMLELAYYFLELNDVTPEIFHLVQFACNDDQELLYEQKMMIIAKFLWQLRHEVELLQEFQGIHRLLGLPLHGMLKEQVDSRAMAHLFNWIRHAISCHPQRAYFKTIGFIMGTGVS